MTNQPTLDRDTKSGKIMAAIFAVLTLLFVCGGGAFVGVAASGSETDGLNAAMAATAPGCCALSGLLAAVLGIFVFPTKKAAQIIAPIVAGVMGGIAGGVGLMVFLTAIWPSL